MKPAIVVLFAILFVLIALNFPRMSSKKHVQFADMNFEAAFNKREPPTNIGSAHLVPMAVIDHHTGSI